MSIARTRPKLSFADERSARAADSADVALWTAAEGRSHITEGGGAVPAKFLLEPEARFLYLYALYARTEHDAQVDSLRMRVGPSWEWKSLRIPVQAYVASDRQDDASYANELRGEVSPTPLFDLGPMQLSDRNRFELGVRRGDFLPRYENRLRLRWQPHDWRVWPYADDELRLDLRTGVFDENRAYLGVALKTRHDQRLEIAGMLRSERNDGNWHQTFDVVVRLVLSNEPHRD